MEMEQEPSQATSKPMISLSGLTRFRARGSRFVATFQSSTALRSLRFFWPFARFRKASSGRAGRGWLRLLRRIRAACPYLHRHS